MGKKTFAPPKKAKKGEVKDQGYHDRAKAEQERFKLATDTEFWVCVCFKSGEELNAFKDRFGIAGTFIKGAEFRKLTGSAKPEKRKQGFPASTKGEKLGYDPLASVEYTHNLEADCLAECLALYEALKGAKGSYKHSSDSDHWLTAVFESREDKEAYLSDWNLWKYGDKYLDGSAWLKAM